jgi:hypothetical protein
MGIRTSDRGFAPATEHPNGQLPPSIPPCQGGKKRGVRPRRFWALLLPVVFVVGCSHDSPTERAQKAVEEIRRSIPDPDATAMAQNADPKTVKEVQQRLRVLNEYMGEMNGELDGVTIHAIEAYQRSAGLPDTGILDAHTLKKLREAPPG